jgi:flagellar motor switch protein FliG
MGLGYGKTTTDGGLMVEELKSQTQAVLETLTDEQVQMVLAYARCVRDMEPAVLNNILEGLLEDPA